ncbi:hypothetical protein FF36_01899 [Frankia torreyi]|uniref:Uncharacterized protein n=1 Tax=Frankia torreyi TaxID=1856 RepID=A0A0D8BIA4_9ACTN|nr:MULTISPECIES: hypothetical protein [Frankia]KJE23714.1 hypothetical protein FF36_01899 [Frankia torreyi]KQM05674.1 hypothetical protein FF86_101492 [Frankia sp. CpI1-P]
MPIAALLATAAELPAPVDNLFVVELHHADALNLTSAQAEGLRVLCRSYADQR